MARVINIGEGGNGEKHGVGGSGGWRNDNKRNRQQRKKPYMASKAGESKQ